MILPSPIPIPDKDVLSSIVQKYTGSSLVAYQIRNLYTSYPTRYYGYYQSLGITYIVYSKGKHTLVFERDETLKGQNVRLWQVFPKITVTTGVSLKLVQKYFHLLDTAGNICTRRGLGYGLPLARDLNNQEITDLILDGMRSYERANKKIYFK